MWAILHPKKGWFCKNDFDGFEFSESLPSRLHFFESRSAAEASFAKEPEKELLEIYYPADERRRKLFEKPP